MSDAVRAISKAQATTSGYVLLAGSLLYVPFAGIFSYILQCTTQNSKYKIQGSNDKESWIDDVVETAIASGASDEQGGSALFLWYRVMIIQDVGGGSIAAQGVAK